MPALPKTIGEHIKKRRLELHLLQTDVARQLGVHVETYKNWERGVDAPMIRYHPKIIEFLGYDPVPEPESVADRVIMARRQLGLTQEALAKALLVDPVTVYRWEKALSVPAAEHVENLDKLLNKKQNLTPR